MVSLWIEGMTLHEFIKMSRESALPLGKRFSILMSIAKGLDYLHSNSIVHGDLSSSNILIRNDGRVFICDFGLSRDISWHGESSLSISKDLNPRWNAPEIILDGRCPTKESDIYAFGSLILETLSGKQPYVGLSSTRIIMQMYNKILPERPESPMVCDESWEMITQCWDGNVYNRPNVYQLIDFLSRAT
ncbi:kinase-like domain-containing protein [Crucibulum laeve]|uniref:Kinase-like domain-containing protein n=1 Tax=Crucibulum laeve TaxID=68775 RepID=A0A5C3M2B5_9AGAR|nr:kinase-like domain-containing protein [Crucibulum laeve]